MNKPQHVFLNYILTGEALPPLTARHWFIKAPTHTLLQLVIWYQFGV